MTGVVIVGSGHGGSQCAASLREAGYEGRVTLINSEAVTPYHKPPLSKNFLKDANAGPQVLRAASYYADHGIDMADGKRVASIDRAAKTVGFTDGRPQSYDYLVLATGAKPRLPDLPSWVTTRSPGLSVSMARSPSGVRIVVPVAKQLKTRALLAT